VFHLAPTHLGRGTQRQIYSSVQGPPGPKRRQIEYKPIASLTSAKAVEFIQDIIFRFGIPNNIITNLGSDFTSSEFFDFYEQRSIQIKYASLAHPRANGQVERANGMIFEALRKKVFDKSEKLAGKWIRELPYVVWSLRTQPS
jgi:transposase InsO family protein